MTCPEMFYVVFYEMLYEIELLPFLPRVLIY